MPTRDAPLRVVFFGTPEFALPSLRALVAHPEIQLEAVVTQPDRPRGRGQQISTSAVKDFSLDAGIYLYQPEKIRDETVVTFFKRMNPDAVIIIAYGQKIPQSLLEIPRLGWINLHGSLLPKYRGAAPINWAIANGERRTGVTTMQVDATMDTGPILLQHETEIGPDETAPELARRMAEAGAPLVIDSLLRFDRGEISPRPQDNALASSAPMLKKEFGNLDWSLPAAQLYNRIRGFDPWPGAYTYFRGQMCRVWGRPANRDAQQQLLQPIAAPGSFQLGGGELYAACGESTWLRVETIQLEGKKRITAREFANGVRLAPDDKFVHEVTARPA
ncbi:MAG TPA: methionyl-tRNA formyltransferase [Candidatus Acidoferrales bacterium]